MSTKKEKKAKVERTLSNMRSQRGCDREAHFAAGGTCAEWRGLHTVTKNGKLHASRTACRTKVVY